MRADSARPAPNKLDQRPLYIGLKTGLNLDKIEDDIEEDREGRLKD